MLASNQTLAFEHAREAFPREACGLLVIRKGREIYLRCRNIGVGSDQFVIHPEDYAAADTVGATTLTEAQIPSHTHSYSWYQSVSKGSTGTRPIGGNSGTSTATVALNQVDSATGGGGSHNHTFTGTAINLAVQYVDVIIATKN